jgi:hypothetical protein
MESKTGSRNEARGEIRIGLRLVEKFGNGALDEISEETVGGRNAITNLSRRIITGLMGEEELLRPGIGEPQIAGPGFNDIANFGRDDRKKLGEFEGRSKCAAEIVESGETLDSQEVRLPFGGEIVERKQGLSEEASGFIEDVNIVVSEGDPVGTEKFGKSERAFYGADWGIQCGGELGMELLVEMRERVRADLGRIDDERFTRFGQAVEGRICFVETNREMRARFGPGGGKGELPCRGKAQPNNDGCGLKDSSRTSGESFEKGFAVATGESDAG